MSLENSTLKELIHQLARELQPGERGLGPGALAELRRLDPEHPGGATFWKLVVQRLEPAGLLDGAPERRALLEQRWAVILAGMAITAGLHQAGLRLGRALAQAEIAEARVTRLLRARGEKLHTAVRLLARQLASAAQPLDWNDLAWLVLSEGNEAHEEEARRRIARDFYRLQTSQDRSQPQGG